MASADHSQPLQDAVIAALLADPVIAATVDDRVFNEEPPTDPLPAWPFIRVEMADVLPQESSCWVGGDVAYTVHVFAHGPSRVPCWRLTQRVLRVLDGVTLAMVADDVVGGPDPVMIDTAAGLSNVLKDTDEPGAYHGAVEFSATTAEEA